jgi:sulfate adenylyltransferase subunit 2
MDHLDNSSNKASTSSAKLSVTSSACACCGRSARTRPCLLWLARKAFFGHVPFPLVHIDTSYKLPEMIQYRDRLALEYKLHMVVGQNEEALAARGHLPEKLKANPP